MTIEEALERVKTAGCRDIAVEVGVSRTVVLTWNGGATTRIHVESETAAEDAIRRVVTKVIALALQRQMTANAITGGEQ